MRKIILCADMDAYFASVEQQTNPKLRGKPVAVIGSGGRTVVTTRSYEARVHGVKTGMNVHEARRACPHLLFVTGDNEKYTHTCTELQKIYLRFTPDVEAYSIDEAFLDVSTTHHLFGGPESIGYAIKHKIREQFRITCTIGIAQNILLAKLASDLAKPDGLRWIKPEEVSSLLENMPLTELWGIGKGLTARLETLGIRTCGELGRAPVSLLRNKFGIIGESLKAMGTGCCKRPLSVREQDPKSIGHSMTFARNLSDRGTVEAEMLKLSEMVGKRARRYGFIGKKVSLTIRYPDFETVSKQTTLHDYTNHTHEIYQNALAILDSIRVRDDIRLLGVFLSDLVKDRAQLYLFKDHRRITSLMRAVDTVNDRYGDFKLVWASYLNRLQPPRVISPAWRPSGIKHIHVRK